MKFRPLVWFRVSAGYSYRDATEVTPMLTDRFRFHRWNCETGEKQKQIRYLGFSAKLWRLCSAWSFLLYSFDALALNSSAELYVQKYAEKKIRSAGKGEWGQQNNWLQLRYPCQHASLVCFPFIHRADARHLSINRIWPVKCFFLLLWPYRCDRRRIPLITDLEYDVFITEHVPKTQLVVISVTSSV